MRDELEPEVLGELAEPAIPAPKRQHGSRRQRRVGPRAASIDTRRISREELRQGSLMYPPVDVPRPRTRGDCVDGPRPCPWAACKHHLYLDVNPHTGSIKINYPHLEPDQLSASCSLDLADQGGQTLDVVGRTLNLTRERVRQIEVRALLAIKMASPSPDEIGAALIHPPEPGPHRRRVSRFEEP